MWRSSHACLRMAKIFVPKQKIFEVNRARISHYQKIIIAIGGSKALGYRNSIFFYLGEKCFGRFVL